MEIKKVRKRISAFRIFMKEIYENLQGNGKLLSSKMIGHQTGSKAETLERTWEMIEINLPLIATAIGLIATIWKFANSISKFGHSVDELTKAMQKSENDRKEIWSTIHGHSRVIERIETQYTNIKEDLDEIKRKVS